jgi:hypothetical protein
MKRRGSTLGRETIAQVLGGLLVAGILAALALLFFHSSNHKPGSQTSSKLSANDRTRVRQEGEKQKREAEEEKQKHEAEEGWWLSNIQNPNKSNINEVNDQLVTISGRTYAHTVELVDLNSECNSSTAPSVVSFTVPPGAKHLSGKFGWTSDSKSSSAELSVYADSTTSKPLWSHPFPDPGLPLMFKQINELAGAHAVIFELVGQQCDNGTFVLAEARFTA